MKQLILHIGSPKTGSSSIQLSLNMSKKLLLKNSFIYYTKKIPHSPWLEPLNSNFFFQDADFEEKLNKFQTLQFEKHGGDLTITMLRMSHDEYLEQISRECFLSDKIGAQLLLD